MRARWQTLMKPAFLEDIYKLPHKDLHQVMEKVTMLTQDPRPDGKVKKHLVHCPGKPHRIRAGDYRIFYTFNDQYVNIYKLDRRDEATYRECSETEDAPEADALNNLEVEQSEVANVTTMTAPDWERIFMQAQSQALPEPITVELLRKLHVPEAYHIRLLRLQNEDELLGCPGIEDAVLIQLHDYMFQRPMLQVMQQPDLVLNEVDDLLRYKRRRTARVPAQTLPGTGEICQLVAECGGSHAG